MAKKILALAMAIALVVCFAVSASAANVETLTTYIAGEAGEPAEAEVTVTVEGVTAGDNVTYYAKSANGDVYVNQEKATGTSVTFNYITAHANIESSAVVVGYTNVEDAYEGTIPDADKYTISYNGDELASVYVNYATVTFAYTPEQYKAVSAVTAKAEAADVEWSYSNNEITATLTNITADVELEVEEEATDIPGFGAVLDIVDAAAIVSTGKVDGVVVGDETVENEAVNAAEGNRKLTVCGKIGSGATEFGIIVSTETIEEKSYRPADFTEAYADAKYQAMEKDDEGKFAVQLIDTEENGTFVAAGTNYYTAVYAITADACYVVPFGTPVAAN